MTLRFALALLAPTLFGAGVTLESGAPVPLRLKQTVSSETARVKDRIEFEVTEDVTAGGVVVIPGGSVAAGRVAEVVTSGRAMRNGKVAIDIESVVLADGRALRLRAARPGAPQARKARGANDLGNVAAMPFTAMSHGKPMEIAAGAIVRVYTAAPVATGLGPEERPSAPAHLEPAPSSGNVLPPVRAPEERPVAPAKAATTAAAGVLPALTPGGESAAPTAIPTSAPRQRDPGPARISSSKKVLTIVAIGAAAGAVGILASRGHGGPALGGGAVTPPTATVGIGSISIGGPR